MNLLYLTASVASTNLIDIPNRAPAKIQNAAPGPPIEIEIATPAILPIPIVPDSAVANAWKDETSPQSPFFSAGFDTTSIECFKPQTETPLKNIVKNIPANKIQKIIIGTFDPKKLTG